LVRAENLNKERLPSNTHLFRADQPGGRPPVRSEISRALEAGRGWATKRDLPDVAGWADLAANPSATREVIARRIDQGRFPLGACLFPLPKPGKHESRPITWLDPFDDLILRCIVGRTTAAIKHSVDRSVVCSYPLETTGAGWKVSNARDANQHRRARGLEELRKESCAALGTLDIERYYESISIERLAEELEGLGAPAGAVSVLSSSLRELESLGGSSGLPIGFEGSGPLGNLYLAEGDAVLRSGGVPVVRYTDDTWAFITKDHSWTECVEAYARVVEMRGLVLKQSKVGLHDKFWGFAEEVIANGVLDYAGRLLVRVGIKRRHEGTDRSRLVDGTRRRTPRRSELREKAARVSRGQHHQAGQAAWASAPGARSGSRSTKRRAVSVLGRNGVVRVRGFQTEARH
jgi:hypothetical protein